jgi:hypothetical protein
MGKVFVIALVYHSGWSHSYDLCCVVDHEKRLSVQTEVLLLMKSRLFVSKSVSLMWQRFGMHQRAKTSIETVAEVEVQK